MEVGNISIELHDWKELSNANNNHYGSLDAFNRTDSDINENQRRIEQILDYFTYVFLGLQILIGLAGNIISLIVWIKGKQCSKIASSLYFKLLAISDIFALISGCWCHIFYHIFRTFLVPNFCRMSNFLFFYPPQLSSWLLVCISIERFLSLTFPLSFTPNGARHRAKVAFIVLSLVLIGINSFAFILEEIDDTGRYCRPRESYREFWRTIARISSVWVLCAVPFCIIIACNIMILIKLCLNNRTNAINKTQSKQRVAMFTQFSLASGGLLAVSLIPSLLYTLDYTYDIFADMPEIGNYLRFASINTLFLSNCLNFLVYCYSSTQFRSDIRNLFVLTLNQQ